MASSLPGSLVRPSPQTLTALVVALPSLDAPLSCGPWLLRLPGQLPFPVVLSVWGERSSAAAPVRVSRGGRAQGAALLESSGRAVLRRRLLGRRLQAGGRVESLPLTRPVTLDKSSHREVPQIPKTSAVDKGGGPFPWTGSRKHT